MKAHLNTLIVAVTILATGLLLSWSFQNRHRAADYISVTGLGTKDFVSDLIVWNGSFAKRSLNLKEAYAALDKDREATQKYLIVKGIPAEKIIFSSIEIVKEFEDVLDPQGNKTRSVFTGYALRQTIQIESAEVDKVENISRQVSELINSGVEFYSNPPEYYYTKLPELKVQMIAAATKDATARAETIAENSNSHVGNLKKADMGVFQIVAQNSSEGYSWSGSYNTAAKRKTATITVSLTFETE